MRVRRIANETTIQQKSNNFEFRKYKTVVNILMTFFYKVTFMENTTIQTSNRPDSLSNNPRKNNMKISEKTCKQRNRLQKPHCPKSLTSSDDVPISNVSYTSLMFSI